MIAPTYLQPGVALKALKRLVETGAIAEATPVFEPAVLSASMTVIAA
jgi:hypothetical protein